MVGTGIGDVEFQELGLELCPEGCLVGQSLSGFRSSMREGRFQVVMGNALFAVNCPLAQSGPSQDRDKGQPHAGQLQCTTSIGPNPLLACNLSAALQQPCNSFEVLLKEKTVMN